MSTELPPSERNALGRMGSAGTDLIGTVPRDAVSAGAEDTMEASAILRTAQMSPAPDGLPDEADMPIPTSQRGVTADPTDEVSTVRRTVTPPEARLPTAPIPDAQARAKKRELKAEYCCAVDRYRLMFARALADRGFANMDYDYRLDRALDRIEQGGAYGILMLHGNLPGETIDDKLLARIRERTVTPVLLIGFPGDVVDTSAYRDVEILPPPVTVAAVADAAERLKPTPQSSLVRRLMELPGFTRHGPDAVTYLVEHAEPTPLYPQQSLYRADEPADSLFFVLAGGVMLSRDDRELDGVGVGAILGESAILEDGARRKTDAVSREATVLLRIRREVFDDGPASFKALVFELIAQTLAPRTRAPR